MRPICRPLAALALLTAVCLFVAGAVPAAQTPQTPVTPPGPLERAAVPVTPENPIPRRITSTLPAYPAEESSAKRTGTVTLRITIDASGRVSESRQPLQPDRSNWPRTIDGKPMLVMGPPLGPAFVKAATAAVSQWRYDAPARAPIALYVKLGFAPGADTELLWHDAKQPDPTPAVTTLTSNPPAVPGGVPAGVPGGVLVSPLGSPSPAPPPPGMPVRVGGQIAAPKKVRDVPPVYPDVARQARVQGVVIIEATIGPTGRVTDAKVLRSVALLDQAAVDAVRQWEFTPTLLNGQPTSIVMSVTVNFTLN